MVSHSRKGDCVSLLLCSMCALIPTSFGGQRRAPFTWGCGLMTPQLSSIILQPQGAAGKTGNWG